MRYGRNPMPMLADVQRRLNAEKARLLGDR
jgi:hypothetical protein